MIPDLSAAKVAEFLSAHSGLWHCDACVSESADVDAYYVAQITRQLASNSDYQRACNTKCQRCGKYRTCTRRPDGKRTRRKKRRQVLFRRQSHGHEVETSGASPTKNEAG